MASDVGGCRVDERSTGRRPLSWEQTTNGAGAPISTHVIVEFDRHFKNRSVPDRRDFSVVAGALPVRKCYPAGQWSKPWILRSCVQQEHTNTYAQSCR